MQTTFTSRRILGACALTVAAVLASACGGSSSTAETTESTEVSTSSTEPDEARAPLTGLPLSDPAVASRPALVAKIDNHPKAQPQAGLNSADIVIEENVEKLTRFAAVHHSQGRDPIGPLRSGRRQDVDILGAFNKPLFVWSGGNARVTRAINASDLVNMGPSPMKSKNIYFRDRARPAPHNLFTKATDIWANAPAESGPPQPQFLYRGASDALPAGAIALAGAKVSMDNHKMQWDWDATGKKWLRSALDSRRKLQPHMEADGTQVSTENVVVLYVRYTTPRSPNARTVGNGKAFVLTDGQMIEGTWQRADRLSPFTILDAQGSQIRLTPGRTFVMLSRVDTFVPVLAGQLAADVKWL